MSRPSRANSGLRIADVTPRIPALSLTMLPTFLNNHMEYNGYAAIRDNVVTTAAGVQYAVWYNSAGHPIIGKRSIPDGVWSTFDLSTVSGNPLQSPVVVDGHNNISLGVDPAGYIHVSGNHHAVPLNYVRSTNVNDITAWTAPGMVGANEDLVTYPQFVTLPNGTFLFFYRNGVSGDGDVFLNKFNTSTKVWSRVALVCQGTGLTPSESPYPTQPMVGADGTLALFVTYRITAQATGNHDIGYIKSADGGVTWTDVSGNALTLPIKSNTTTSGGTGSALPLAWTGNNLINSSGSALDTKGRPHTAIWLASSGMNLHHIWWDGSTWHDDTILTGIDNGGNTSVTCIARVSVVCTNAGRTLLMYRITLGDAAGLWVRDVTSDQTPLPTFRLADIDLQGYEPTYDYQAVRTLNQLHMLVTPIYRSGLNVTTGISGYTSQWGGVLSVDLSQLGPISSGTLAPPTLTRISRTSTAPTSATATPADVASSVLPTTDRLALILARVAASASSGAGVVNLRQRPVNTSSELDLTGVPVGPVTATASTITDVASNGVKCATFNGAGTLTVASTTGFASSGTLLVIVGMTQNAQDVGPILLTYTGKTGTTFTGCTADLDGQTDNVIFWTANPVTQLAFGTSPWQPIRADLSDVSAGVKALGRIAATAGSTLVTDAVATELAVIGQPGRPLTYAAPKGLTPSLLGKLAAYWKFSALGLTNGANVTTVADSSGNSGPGLAPPAGKIPTFNTTGINSKPAVQFTGTQVLDATATLSLAARGWTVITVASCSSLAATNQEIVCSDDSGANATRIFQIRYDNSGTTVTSFGFDSPAAAVTVSSATLSPSAATARIVSFRRTPGMIQTWLNGQLATQTATSSTVPNVGTALLHVGGRGSGNGTTWADFLTGFVGDVFVFNEPLSIAERRAVESLLAVTYGITLP